MSEFYVWPSRELVQTNPPFHHLVEICSHKLTVNKLHLVIALKTTKSQCLILMKYLFYLSSATIFEVKDFPPCCFTKPVKSPCGWFSTKRRIWCQGKYPHCYTCASLCHLRWQLYCLFWLACAHAKCMQGTSQFKL